MADQQTDDTKPQPTEEQVKRANDAEMAKWKDDFEEDQLAVPYKPEKDDGKEEGEKPEDGKPAVDNTVEDDDDYEEPAPDITIEDPGEFKPDDYSFEVTIKDGDKTRTVKVSTPEEAERIADNPDNFDTPKQLMDFLNKQQKMVAKLDRDKEKWQAQKDTFDEQSKVAQEKMDYVQNLAAEFDYLAGKGLIPTVPNEYKDADWSDPEVAKQPGVKEQLELLNYINKENKVRAKAGIKHVTSAVDAYNAMMLDKTRKAEKEATKQAGEARKAASSRVAAVSASAQTPRVPNGIAVGNPNVFKRNQAVWDN